MVTRIITLAFLVCISSTASASTSSAGTVSNAIVNRASRFFFNQNGSRSARPACSVDRWVIDVSTSAGQAMMSLILTAQAQNRPIVINGTGACAEWSDTEGVDLINVP